MVDSPPTVPTDTGLAAHLMGIDASRLAQDRALLGGLLESFDAMELVEQAGWSADAPALYHLRTHGGDEVDLVLERRSGELVGVEVKSAATVTGADFKGLRALAEVAGRRFRCGVALYTGGEAVPFGERLYAVPVEALWRWGAQRPRTPSASSRGPRAPTSSSATGSCTACSWTA
jgi:hypothetical protein